jgi:hypothetical protein
MLSHRRRKPLHAKREPSRHFARAQRLIAQANDESVSIQPNVAIAARTGLDQQGRINVGVRKERGKRRLRQYVTGRNKQTWRRTVTSQKLPSLSHAARCTEELVFPRSEKPKRVRMVGHLTASKEHVRGHGSDPTATHRSGNVGKHCPIPHRKQRLRNVLGEGSQSRAHARG